MSDRRRSPTPRAHYPFSSRSSPDPAVSDRYSRSSTPDGLNFNRYSLSLGDVSSVENDNFLYYRRRDSLLSCPSPRNTDYSENDNVLGSNRPLTPSGRSSSHEEIISSHKHVSKLQQDLMAANKKIGRMDVLYEETNRRKGKLQDELLEACTKVAKLEATCASFKEKEAQWQKDMMTSQQRSTKLETDVLSAFKKITQLETELERVESAKNSVQHDHVSAQGKISLLEAVIDKMKQQRSTVPRNEDWNFGNQKILELEARNERISHENDELRRELRHMRNKNMMVEDELSGSPRGKSYLKRILPSEAKEPERDSSVEILLNEVNKYKQLYENAVKMNSEDGEYKKLLAEVERSKDECSKAEEKLFVMLEYEVKYKEAKMNCEETLVELNGAKRKLTLAEEQLQKALREKAAIAMEVGKINDKNLKYQETLTSMEMEIENLRNALKEADKNGRDTEEKLQKVLKERQSLAKHCQELTKEMRESDAELEQVLALGENMRGQLEQMKGSLVDKGEECTELMRIKNALKEELEESSATLSQVESELSRCKCQLSEYKDNVDIWEHKENEGAKRVKQLSLEVDELSDQLEKKTSESIELKNKLRCCHDDKEHVTEELETLQDKMVTMETALNRVEREKTGWEDKESDFNETINKKVFEIKRLKKELEEQKTEAENVFRKNQDEIMKAKQCSNEVESLEAKCSSLGGKLSEVERKYDAIVAERQELRREILKYESDVSQLDRSLALSNKEKSDLLSEIEKLSSLKSKQDGVIIKMERELMEFREVHEELIDKNQDNQVTFKKQTSELKTSLEKLESKTTQVNELIERCESLKLDRKQLRDDLLNAREEASSLEIQLDKEARERENLSDEINETRKKVKRREDDIESLENKLAEQADILERGNRRTREEQGQMRIVRQELDIQVENFQEKCAELEQAKGKLESLQQEYETKKKECLNLETMAAKFESQVNKLEREKGDLICEVENRNNGLIKQNENVTKLQKQVKEVREKLENSEMQVDELRQTNQKQAEENRALFKQVSRKTSDCLELETNIKDLQSHKNSLAKNLKKVEEKCGDLEKQIDTEFREKLKLAEALRDSEGTRERAASDVSRYKDQVKEYKTLYEANVKDSVVRKDSLEKKTLQNQELHKKYSQQAMKLSEVERELDAVKATNNRLSKDNFMKQTKITKVEELLEKAMQENVKLKATEQEAQRLLNEMNEDAEDYELEIQTLKLRLCEQQATVSTLEKTNVILSESDESGRVRESLKKLGELEKGYQTVSFAKDELELQLAAANEIIKQNKTLEMELTEFQQALRQTEEQLSDIEIQYSSVAKENASLKENIVRLEDGLKASDIEKDKLKNELKEAQNSKKSGYARGGLFINNHIASSSSKTEGKTNMKFIGPETSTPLSSPRRSIHSRSFEIQAPKQRVLKRHYSLDSLNVASFNRGLSGRLSMSLENLGGDWPKDNHVAPKVMDTSYDSLTGSDFSITVSDVSELSRKQSLDEVDVKGLEDWETVSDVSSVMTADTLVLTDLETNVDQSDCENVNSLKHCVEQVGIKQPSKATRRRSSSLTRTTSLTTLVEKQEEGTSISEEVTNVAEATASASKVGAKIPGGHSKSSDVKTSDLSTTDVSGMHTTYLDRGTKTVATIPPASSVKPYDSITALADIKVSVLPAKPPDHSSEIQLLENTPKKECTSTRENVQGRTADALVNSGDTELERKNTEATFEHDCSKSGSTDTGYVTTTSSDIEMVVSDALSSCGDFESHGVDFETLPSGDSKATTVERALEEKPIVNQRSIGKTEFESLDVKIVSETSSTDDILNHYSQFPPSDPLPQPHTSVSSGAVLLLQESNLPHSSVGDNSRNLETATILTNSNLSPYVSQSKISDVRNPRRNEQNLLSFEPDSIQNLDSLQDTADFRKNSFSIVNANSVQSSDVQMNVKNMKNLWEKRENNNTNSPEVKYKRTKKTNIETRPVSPGSSSGSERTVRRQISDVEKDGEDGKTPKPAKVSELVSLWNKFN